MKESTEPLPFEDFEIERREVMIKQFERGEKKTHVYFLLRCTRITTRPISRMISLS